MLNILEQLFTHIKFTKKIMIDASVAVQALSRGYTKRLAYLNKTTGIDVAGLCEVLVKNGIEIVKVASADNLADLFTKALTKPQFVELLRRMIAP